jgi:uncharacterized protein
MDQPFFSIAIALGMNIALLSMTADGRAQGPYRQLSSEEQARVEAVLPESAPAPVDEPRKLLIYDGNVGYGGHGSIPFANFAFTRMGERTGTFTTVVSRDPEVFRKESLDRFDAVCLNNTVGNLFADPELRRNLIEFVLGGGGLLGVHGTTVAFTDFPQGARETWPEFARMIGARGAAHLAQDERVMIQLDSPGHPLNRPFGGQGFEHVSEFFRVRGPYSRDQLHVLFSIDAQRTDLPPRGTHPGVERDDEDYALAWTRSYGRGRVVYCTIGHSPQDFMTPRILEFYLHALQFIMGDLDGTTTPTNRLTPAVAARESLGWRLALTAQESQSPSVLEMIDRARRSGLAHIQPSSLQRIGEADSAAFDSRLSDEQIESIRLAMDDAGVSLPALQYAEIPDDMEGRRRVFEFCRKLGVETLIGAASPESLDDLERLGDQYDIRLAIMLADSDRSNEAGHFQRILEICRGRSTRIGVYGDVDRWLRAGLDPIDHLRKLGDRLITLRLTPMQPPSAREKDGPQNVRGGNLHVLLAELHRQGVQPTVLGLADPSGATQQTAGLPETIDAIDGIVDRIVREERQ